MQYISTRGEEKGYNSAVAIKMGIASDGGLFVPKDITSLTEEEISKMTNFAQAS